jgi:hypothetical protein
VPQKFTLSYLNHGVGSPLRVSEDDVKLVLDRLPENTWNRFQVIHFNDPRRGLRWLGYINHERAEIAISLLPPGVRRVRFVMRAGQPSRVPRATRRLSPRREMLFDVLLDDIGHLQILDERVRDGVRLRSYEPRPAPHTDYWRLRLWSFKFASAPKNGANSRQKVLSEVIEVSEE